MVFDVLQIEHFDIDGLETNVIKKPNILAMNIHQTLDVTICTLLLPFI
jgi:hypothetical protein